MTNAGLRWINSALNAILLDDKSVYFHRADSQESSAGSANATAKSGCCADDWISREALIKRTEASG